MRYIYTADVSHFDTVMPLPYRLMVLECRTETIALWSGKLRAECQLTLARLESFIEDLKSKGSCMTDMHGIE